MNGKRTMGLVLVWALMTAPVFGTGIGGTELPDTSTIGPVEKSSGVGQPFSQIGSMEFRSRIAAHASNSGGPQYDLNRATLRSDTFIESALNTAAGLGFLDMYRIGVMYADQAKNAALSEFPNDVMLRDAFRHFAWNNISAKGAGVAKTQIVTTNHEWGVVLLNPATNYYDSQYAAYRAAGVPDAQAADDALADTENHLATLKSQKIAECQSDFGAFLQTFSASNVMDLYNNHVGRTYAVSNPALSYRDGFYAARGNGQLILSESSVTVYNYLSVWSNQRYVY